MQLHKRTTWLSFIVCIMLLSMLFLSGCDDDNPPVGSDDPPIEKPVAGYTADDFEASETCQPCHPVHFKEWSGSMHAYAVKDPVWMSVNIIGQSQYTNALDQACVPCHATIGMLIGETPHGGFDPEDMSPVAAEGVGCDICHIISGIHGLENGRFDIEPGPVKFGTIENPVATSAHESEYSPLYARSEYCGSCHDFVTGAGLELENTYREWIDGGHFMTKKTCNDCHMATYEGPAAVGGPDRTVHRHDFIGADVALIDFPNKAEQFEAVTEMMQNALTLGLVIPDTVTAGANLPVTVNVTNDLTGHSVPSGVPFNRQMWLAVVVIDGVGDTVYSSGQLDANLDLMDENSAFAERDADLVNFQAQMYRADSTKTGGTWDVAYLDNPAIKPTETRASDYSIPIPADTPGPLDIFVKLRFRTFPPHVLRAVGNGDLLPIPIIDMESDSVKAVTVL